MYVAYAFRSLFFLYNTLIKSINKKTQSEHEETERDRAMFNKVDCRGCNQGCREGFIKVKTSFLF